MGVDQSNDLSKTCKLVTGAAVEGDDPPQAEALGRSDSAEPWPPLYVNLLLAIPMLAELDPDNAASPAPPREPREKAGPSFKRASRVVANALMRGDLVARTVSGRGEVVSVHPDDWQWIGNESYWDKQLQDNYWFSWIEEAERRFQSLDRLWVRSCDLLALQHLFIPPLSLIRTRAAPSADTEPPKAGAGCAPPHFLRADTDLSYLMLQDIGEVRGHLLSFEEEKAWATKLGITRERLRELRRRHRTSQQQKAGRPRKSGQK